MVNLPDIRQLASRRYFILAVPAFFLPWMLEHRHAIAPWLVGLCVAGVILVAWIFAYRRYRQYADTPCAQIGSAPQGYTAIAGIGRPIAGAPLLSPLNGLPCLWYRFVLEVRDDNGKWRQEADETSDASFLIEDADGNQCAIDPVSARIETSNVDRVISKDRRTTQWLLIAGTRLYATGNFVSRRPIDDRAAFNTELRDKLADWKDSGEAMRFDTNGDGALDMQEWEQARDAARQEVAQEREAAADFADYHTLTAPQDGRPFIISNQDPRRLIRRYQLHAWSLLALFFIALSFSAWAATRG